jgi:hypothetical protein
MRVWAPPEAVVQQKVQQSEKRFIASTTRFHSSVPHEFARLCAEILHKAAQTSGAAEKRSSHDRLETTIMPDSLFRFFRILIVSTKLERVYDLGGSNQGAACWSRYCRSAVWASAK